MINTNHEVILLARIEFVVRLLDGHNASLWQIGEDGRFAVVIQGQLLHLVVLIFNDRDCSHASVGVADGLENNGLIAVMCLDAQRGERYLQGVSCGCRGL